MKVKWLELALDDLDSAIEYIETENPPAALRVAERIWQASKLLSANPEMGRIGRIGDTREWVVNKAPYIIAYRVKNNSLEIMRVIHAKQSWPKTLDKK